MNPTYPLAPIANFIACGLTITTLSHMVTRPWNTGVYIFALWLFLLSFSTAINGILWSDNVKDTAPVWCDICKSFQQRSVISGQLKTGLKASHLIPLVNTGIPACSFVITRRLYKIIRHQGTLVSRRQVSSLYRWIIWTCFHSDYRGISSYYWSW